MKLMFNEVGGRKFNTNVLDCHDCIFCHSKCCTSLRLNHPFHKWCGNEIYRKTSLGIFYL